MVNAFQSTKAALSRTLSSAFVFDSRWLRPAQIWLALVLLAGLGWLQTFSLIEQNRASVMEVAENDISNLGRVGMEHAERTFFSLDQALKVARGQYLEHGDRLDFATILPKSHVHAPEVYNIYMLDAHGMVQKSTHPYLGPTDLSERDYFKGPQGLNEDTLYISDTEVGKTVTEPTLYLSRRITLNNGGFGGVMVAAISPKYFTRFYADLELGQHSIATLLKSDGTILARRFGKQDQFEGQLRTYAVIKHLNQNDSMGTFVFRSELDNIERIFHFRKLPSFALMLTFAQSTDVVLAGQQQARAILLRQATVVSGLMLLVGIFMSWYSVASRRASLSHLSDLIQLKALINRAPGVVYQYLLRPDGTRSFLFVSDGAYDTLGLSPQMAMENAALVFELVHPDDVVDLNASIGISAKNLTQWRHEFRMCHADGSVRWVAGNSTPKKLADGSVQWDGFISDITEHKRNETAANAANEAKSDFLSRMSHEIRSPLNAILGLAYLLEHADLDTDAHYMVRNIRASGRILLGLISDILDVSKIESGQMLIEQAPFRLADVLDSVAVVLRVAVGDKAIKLVIAPPPPGVYTLIGDVLRLEQVLLNLSVNAIKFTSEGQVELRSQLLSSNPEEVVIRFSVHDTGIGIAAEFQSQVFAAFTQASSSTSRRFGGTGLGLTICHQLVTLMGGEIGVTSVLGEGSEFWFTLPLKKVADSAILPADMRRLEALIVDDSAIALQYVSQIATGLSWNVQAFDSTATLLNHLMERRNVDMPDVVVLEWKMPGLDGLATARTLRDRLPPERCPLIIMMTNHSLASLVRHAGVEQVDALLEKPVTASNLHHAMLEARRKRAATEGVSFAVPILASRALLGIRVLVVDDSDINCEVAQRILVGQGAVVSLASNGQEAMDWLLKHPKDVDLVLMDVQMPVMDGIEATRKLRRMSDFARLPIVALTAGAFKSQQEAAHAAGMTHFISKPFDVPSTIALIRRLTVHRFTSDVTDATVSPVPAVNTDMAGAVMDVTQGLGLWGDMASYQDYLLRFAGLYRNAVTMLREHMDRADPAGAIALAHKLAGVASSMALQQTHVCAAEVERALRSEEDPTQPLAQLDDALALALAAIERLTAHDSLEILG